MICTIVAHHCTCRDRAAERRQGINPDYDETELAALTGDAVAKLTVEESKFLGGDIDHTHLVRGLDFQLLNRVRDKLSKQPSSKQDDEAEVLPTAIPVAAPSTLPQRAVPPQPRPSATETAPARAAARAPEPAAGPRFATPLGRRVFDAIFRPARLEIAEHFLPRRTAFVYELDALDVPTTLRRSQADCPKVAECMVAVMHEQLLQRVTKIMSYVGPSGKRRKKAQRLAEAAAEAVAAAVTQPAANEAAAIAQPPPCAPLEDDGDIFEDAGTEYVPTLPSKDAPANNTAAVGIFTAPAPRPVAVAPAPRLPDTHALVKEVEEGDDQGCVCVLAP